MGDTTRAKVRLQEISHNCWNPGSATLIFRCEYDTSIPEDQRFYKETPSGEFRMLVNNPKVLEKMKLGSYYYLDLTETTNG